MFKRIFGFLGGKSKSKSRYEPDEFEKKQAEAKKFDELRQMDVHQEDREAKEQERIKEHIAQITSGHLMGNVIKQQFPNLHPKLMKTLRERGDDVELGALLSEDEMDYFVGEDLETLQYLGFYQPEGWREVHKSVKDRRESDKPERKSTEKPERKLTQEEWEAELDGRAKDLVTKLSTGHLMGRVVERTHPELYPKLINTLSKRGDDIEQGALLTENELEGYEKEDLEGLQELGIYQPEGFSYPKQGEVPTFEMKSEPVSDLPENDEDFDLYDDEEELTAEQWRRFDEMDM